MPPLPDPYPVLVTGCSPGHGADDNHDGAKDAHGREHPRAITDEQGQHPDKAKQSCLVGIPFSPETGRKPPSIRKQKDPNHCNRLQIGIRCLKGREQGNSSFSELGTCNALAALSSSSHGDVHPLYTQFTPAFETGEKQSSSSSPPIFCPALSPGSGAGGRQGRGAQGRCSCF